MSRKEPPRSGTRIRLETGPEQASARPVKRLSLIAALAIILFFFFWFSLLFIVPYRQWGFTPAWIFESVKNRFGQLAAFFMGRPSVIGVTVYQYLAVIITGAALSACGAVFQGSFRNLLAGPSTMGVMSGGTLGLMIYLLALAPAPALLTYATADLTAYHAQSFTDAYGQQLFTLLGCVAGIALTVGIATAAGRGKLSASAMIVSGTVFSALTMSIAQLLQYYMIMRNPSDTRIQAMRDMMLGNFNKINGLRPLLMLAIPLIVCICVLLALRRRMNLLALNEDEAAAIGSDLRRFRYVLIAAGTVITAVVVSFCGHIGFLGFMIPLIGRRLVGPDMSKLLPVSVLGGGIFLMLVFDVAYIAGMTDYLNVFTSAIGGCAALTVLLKREGGAA